jgi:hypothetical protein
MFCPQCGSSNEEDALFCGECGAILDAEDGAETVIEEPAGLAQPAAAPSPSRMTIDAPPPPASPAPPTYGSATQTSGMAIASLVLGITGWTILPLIGSILAIILGYAARSEIRQRPDELTGEGMAVAGLVLGWLAVVLSILLLCIGGLGFCFFFALAGSSSGGW